MITRVCYTIVKQTVGLLESVHCRKEVLLLYAPLWVPIICVQMSWNISLQNGWFIYEDASLSLSGLNSAILASLSNSHRLTWVSPLWVYLMECKSVLKGRCSGHPSGTLEAVLPKVTLVLCSTEFASSAELHL